MEYSVTVKTAPVAEPVTLAQAKLHLRIGSDDTDQDELISALIVGAREWVENYCRRSFVQRTLELRLECFPGCIYLPRGPVSSVTSVKYVGADGNLATVAADAYQTDLYSIVPEIEPVFGTVWPIPKVGTMNAVVVEYVAGYAPGQTSPTDWAENVPASVKAAMKLIVGHLYENREAVVLANVQAIEVPFAVKMLLAPFEIRDFCLE